LVDAVHRQRRLRQRWGRQQPAAGRGVRDRAGRRDDRLPARRAAAGRVRGPLMQLSGSSKWLLRLGTAVTLVFLYVPLIVIAIYAFTKTRVQKWPPTGLTLHWFSRAFENRGVRDALLTSVKAGLGATALALVLGTLASIAVARYRFFGREAVSFLVILPIALP